MNENLKKFLLMVSEEQKKQSQTKSLATEPVSISRIDETVQLAASQKPALTGPELLAARLSKKVTINEQQNDPLVPLDQKFVTLKEMNDHYGLFLSRIQQQLSSLGGGGEVKMRRLDDVDFPSVGLNKYLTYDPTVKKFTFDTISTGDGLYLNGSNALQLKIASNTEIGGVRLGPGVAVNNQGQIIIDSSGLDFSFGDFQATVPSNGAATLSSVNLGQNIDIVSTANGVINAVGNFHVHTPDTYDPIDPDANGAIFRVDASGKVRMLVPDADSSEGAVNIIGGLDGGFQAPVNTGVMLHITGIAGTPGIPSRVYNDAQNAFAAFVSRRYNNTALAPTAVLADEEIMRLSGTAHNGTTIPGTANQRIVYKALGNQTPSNQGGAIELWATPINTTTLAKIATVDSIGITLESGKILSGSINGNANTATTSTNLAAATSILAGSVSINPLSVTKNSASTQTFTLSGLTTNHKITITPETALPFGLIVASAWASATNTLSITFHNYSNADVDQGATNIQYFAWV